MAAKTMTATTKAATKTSDAATTAVPAKKAPLTKKDAPAKKAVPARKSASARKGAATKAAPAGKTTAKTATPVAPAARNTAASKTAASQKAPVKNSGTAKPAAKTAAPIPKAAVQKSAAAKPAVQKSAAAKPAVRKSAAAKPAMKPAGRTKTIAGTPKGALANQVIAGKSAAAKQATPARTAPQNDVVQKARPARKAAATTKALPRKTTAATAGASTTTRTAAPLKRAGTGSGSGPAVPRVATSEKPWTATELREIRTELESERSRALADLKIAESDLQGLLTNAGEGAGDDQADAGASIFGREYEMVLANNSREKLKQVGHALERLDDGSYGVCESCGNAIGKIRLQAAPRATLCLACKTKQESR